MAMLDDRWACPACTLLNPSNRSVCEVCETPRAGARPQASPAAPVLQLGSPAAPETAQLLQQKRPAPAEVAPSAASASAGSRAAGLNEEERKRHQDDLAAIRRQKEEEKKRILRQAEADRRARMDLDGRSAAALPDNAAAIAPAPAPKAIAATQSQSVRLQVRCPHWGRTVVFTCFTPTSTLGDVRECLREDLVNGVAGSGDGRITGSSSSVPALESFILVDTVGRRRWQSAEDMELTLQAVGLCPSASLLAEAQPVAVPADNIEHVPVAAPAHPAPAEDRHSNEDEEDEDDEDGSHSDDESGSDAGRSPPTGSGTFGHGQGTRRPYGGNRSANWRFGVHDSGPSQGPRIGSGGEILGSASQASTGTGTATVADPDQQRAMKEARLARLAALERQAPAAAPSTASTAAVEQQPATTVVATAATAPAPVELHGKKKKDAEKQEILKRIAEERAEREALRGHGGATSSASNAVAAGESSATNAPAVIASAKPSAAGAVSQPPPVLDVGRVKGQLGGGPNKAERAKERERILQSLHEDRSHYEERHVPVAVTSNPVVVAALTADAQMDAAVRLQLRCSVSGRMITSTTFTGRSCLRDILDFAVSELGLSAEQWSQAPVLALPYPPRTVFSEEEHLAASLHALGLCPSATLTVKWTPMAAVTLSEVTETDTQAVAGVQGAEVSESQQVGQEEQQKQEEDLVASTDDFKCPAGHVLEAIVASEDGWCDRCQQGLAVGIGCFECKACDFVQCRSCCEEHA